MLALEVLRGLVLGLWGVLGEGWSHLILGLDQHQLILNAHVGVVSELLLLIASDTLSLVGIVVAERLSVWLIRLPTGNLSTLHVNATALESQVLEIIELIDQYFLSLHNSILLLYLIVLNLTKTLNQA